jgi:sulfatase modifying factor 1
MLLSTIAKSSLGFLITGAFLLTDPDPSSFEFLRAKTCPAGTVRVKGMALPAGSDMVEVLQDSTCDEWISTQFPARCARFNREKWIKVTDGLKTKRHQMDFCMDTYEWPNEAGATPLVFIDWYSAKKTCEAAGKRLCTEEEWTFACEGEEGLPYPYGYERDATVCNIDHKWIAPDVDALQNPAKRGEELLRLWQGVPSGTMERCVSPFGVHDMTGNVDEWTSSTRKSGYRSILKGGYWSVVRTRCRPSTRIHNETFAFYQQGMRCCSDVK